MTASLESFMKSRDQQVAEDFGKMAELGYMDTEFMAYGCAYWADKERKYLVSNEAKKIYEFIEQGIMAGICPTPLLGLQKICPVPSGQITYITQDVKRQLAVGLSAAYSEAFFELLAGLTNKPALDSAKAILLPIQDQLETRYDADQLRLFEGLLNLAYQGKVLTPKSYGQLKAWLVDIYEQMEDDVIVKDLFEKVFYGIAYEALDGTLHYYANAQNERLFERKSELEAEGITVSPIFAKAYYYNLRYNVSHAREDFNRYLAKIMDQSYLDKVKEIKALPSALDEEAFRQKQDLAASNYGEKAAEALGQYGRMWHIQNQG